MALSGKPVPTAIQVGTDAYFMYNNIPQKAKVRATSSEVTNPNSDSSGETKIMYYLEGYSKAFKSENMFDSYQSLILHLSILMGILIDFPVQLQ